MEVDRTLLTLIPRPSRRRNLLLGVAALVTLVGAWLSPMALRPSVSPADSAGSWSALSGAGQIVVVSRLEPNGWPTPELVSVTDVPGAVVSGAWLVPATDLTFDEPARPADHGSGLDYLRAAAPGRRFDESSALPQPVRRGVVTQLVVIWDVVDCSSLSPDIVPSAELRTVVGTTVRDELPDLTSPGFDVPTLVDNGMCR